MKGFSGIWLRRPILWILFFYILGLVLSIYVSGKLLLIYLAMLIFIGLALLWRPGLFYCLLAIILLFGILRGSLFYNSRSSLDQFVDMEVRVTGKLLGQAQEKEDVSHYIVKVDRLRQGDITYRVLGKIRVSVYYDEIRNPMAYRPGSIVELEGTLKLARQARNPGVFDYRAYLARRGIHQIMTIGPDDMSLVKKASPLEPNNMLSRLASLGATGLDAAVGGQEGDLLKAMVLGQRWLIEPNTSDSFSRTGLAHILAISGLHVGYIVLLINKLSAKLRLRTWGLFIFRSSIIIFYCLLTGAATSVVRATIMAIIVFLGQAIGRKPDTLNSAGTAALLILIFRPMEILDTGFQLSFITVFSIGLLYRDIKDKLGFLPDRLASLFAVTISAQLGALPLIAYHFNSLSLISFLTNPLLIPVFGLLVMAGFLIMPIGIILPGLAFYIGIPIKVITRILLGINTALAGLPFSAVRVVSPPIIAIIIFFIIILILSRDRPSFIKRPLATAIVIAFVFLVASGLYQGLRPKELKIVFLDVGQGDCTYIRTPDGLDILLDGGGREGSNIGQDVVIPFLLKNGVASLDLLIMSHCDYDHIGGLLPLVEELRVREFLEYPPGEENETYRKLKAIVLEKGIKTHRAKRGQSFKLGDKLRLEILYPDDGVVEGLAGGNENNYSLVKVLYYGDRSVMFTGDIEGPVEDYLVSQGIEEVDVLKVAHHGSNSSSSQAFLDLLSPEIGVIQVGNNSYGHPSIEVLERLDQLGTKIYRNDLNGAIILSLRGDKWQVDTMIK